MDDQTKLLIVEPYVNNVKRLRLTIDTCSQEIERLRAQADGLKSVAAGDKVSASADVHKLEDVSAKIMDLVKIYTADMAAFVAEYEIAHRCMSQLDGILPTLFVRHYLMGQTWERICIDVNYSYRRVMDLRHDGIIALYDLLPYSVREEWRQRAIPKST